MSSAPTVASWGSGRLDVFARGLDGRLYHQWFSGSWSGWIEAWQGPLGQPTASNAVAVSRAPGVIDVFVRGVDGQMYHGWYDGTWHFWESLSGQITSGPAAASWSSGRLDIFARGTDGRLYHQYWNVGVGWSGWVDGWSGPGGAALASDPGAVSRASGVIDVFARGSNGGLYHGWFDGAWHFSESLGGTLY